jgi:L-alanine-DL-glutamate epimerase-like enolase superfamily enzyme
MAATAPLGRDGYEQEAAPTGPPVERLAVSAFTVPTDRPESDGTLRWDATTLVLAEATAGGETGLGYTYSHVAAAHLAESLLADVVTDLDALDVGAAWHAMQHAVRNLGQGGLAASAIAAVDAALWDLKARLLGQPLVVALDAVRRRVPVYGSGGFTSYADDELREQFARWRDAGIRLFKMKVGREPERDLDRVRLARQTVGDDAGLMVDANGALTRKQALYFAHAFADLGVTWFEEPVSSDDLDGLRLLRDEGPPGLEITAGEYGYRLFDFHRLLDAGAVDCLQADATRCAGPTGFRRVAALCAAHTLDLSAHTAPSLHGHLGCAVVPFRHVEYFHDHVRLEALLFDGALTQRDGFLTPDRSRPGNGFVLKRADAERYTVYQSHRS